MKKRLIVPLMLLFVCALSACADAKSAAPYAAGEHVFRQTSVTALAGQYGDYTYETAYAPRTGATTVKLVFDGLVVCLADSGSALSFSDSGGEGYVFGTVENVLTQADLDLQLPVSYALWTREDLAGPRGAAVGDSLKSVTSKFLDRSSDYEQFTNEYDDSFILYTARDLPGRENEDDGLVGGRYDLTQAGNLFLDITADYDLFYYTGAPEGELTRFYFDREKLVAIEQAVVNLP